MHAQGDWLVGFGKAPLPPGTHFLEVQVVDLRGAAVLGLVAERAPAPGKPRPERPEWVEAAAAGPEALLARRSGVVALTSAGALLAGQGVQKPPVAGRFCPVWQRGDFLGISVEVVDQADVSAARERHRWEVRGAQ